MLSKKRQLAFQMLKFVPRKQGIETRLPETYMKFYKEYYETEPKPVHFIPESGRYKKDPRSGLINPVQNIPIPTLIPKQLHQCLTGGELVVRGHQKRDPKKRRVPHFWVPTFYRSVVYSEILNKHYSAIVTKRLISLIHEHKGFDNYLLQERACDLKTKLALRIKKEILKALLEKNLPYDAVRNEELYEKYQKFIIPKAELEWYGLDLYEACQKQDAIEDAEMRNYVPLKHELRRELIEELKGVSLEAGQEKNEPADGKKSGWLKKLAKPFGPKET